MKNTLDELEETFTEIDTLSKYPSIGKILTSMANIVDLNEDQQDRTKAFRKKLERLENQKQGIDLDNYRKVLEKIIKRYDKLTETYDFHWLSGSQIFHYFSAYQSLLKYVPVTNMNQDLIDGLMGTAMISWTIRRYAVWDKNYKKADDDTGLWILKTLDYNEGFKRIIGNLKKNLSDENMSHSALYKRIDPQKYNKDELKEKTKQMNKWFSGENEPQFSTIKTLLIDPLQKVNLQIANIFLSDYLSWRWFREWIKWAYTSKKIEPEKTLNILNSSWNILQESTLIDDFTIPSQGFFNEEDLIDQTLWNFAPLTGAISPEFISYWSEEVLQSKINWWLETEKDSLAVKMRQIKLSEYRNGYDFHKICKTSLESIEDLDSKEYEEIFKLEYLHGWIPSSFRDSKAWRKYQTQKKQDNIHSGLLDQNYNEWLRNWTSRDIYTVKDLGSGKYTQLMVAVFRGDFELVNQLLEEKADPNWISKSYNESALFLALYKLMNYPGYSKEMERIVHLLLIKMKGYENAAKVMNTQHSISRERPIDIAIRLGKPEWVNAMLDLGTDINGVSGGDDRAPIDHAISAYQNYFTLKHDWNNLLNQDINKTRMVNSPEIINEMMDLSEDLKRPAIDMLRSKLPSSPRFYLTIIKSLILKGADLNLMNSGGRYPLDRAIETEKKEIIKLLKENGAHKIAVF